MKKIIFLILVSTLILPAALFAEAPSDDEVLETTSAVLAAFGIVLLTSMFGESPEGIDSEVDMDTGKSRIMFQEFDLDSYFKMLSELGGGSSEEADMPAVQFRTMTGTISVNEDGNVNCDMAFNGGNVATLTFNTTGENIDYLKANGLDYSHLDLGAIE